MMNKIIIGINGKLGSGKDSFAEMLSYHSDLSYERHAFADTLREMVECLTGYPLQKVYHGYSPFENVVKNYSQDDKNVVLADWNMTVGEILQKVGTEGLRDSFDKEVWIKALYTKIKSTDSCVVIPDVRFKNEADAIKSWGGLVFRIEGDPAGIRKNSKRDLNHPSEIDLDDYDKFDEIIVNDGSLEELNEKIKLLINKYNI